MLEGKLKFSPKHLLAFFRRKTCGFAHTRARECFEAPLVSPPLYASSSKHFNKVDLGKGGKGKGKLMSRVKEVEEKAS